MPIVPYVNCAEASEGAVIWRFMDLRKFSDLMASEELYFRRADLFSDKSEGLPPEEYARRVLGLDPYDIHDRVKLNDPWVFWPRIASRITSVAGISTVEKHSICGSNTAVTE